MGVIIDLQLQTGAKRLIFIYNIIGWENPVYSHSLKMISGLN